VVMNKPLGANLGGGDRVNLSVSGNLKHLG
jgi:hypothetical protein